MVRFTQLKSRSRRKKQPRGCDLATTTRPQRKVVCLRLLTKSPKKPNSANRRVAKTTFTKLGKRLNIFVKIPGERHNLQQHSVILVRCGRVRDLVGVSNVAVRGKFDLIGVANRKSSRSVYGVKLQDVK